MLEDKPGPWYRYDDYLESTGYIDVSGEWVAGRSRVRIRCLELGVVRLTPKGAWVRDFSVDRGERFVRREGKKRYACPTREEALESFMARKQRQEGILRARADDAHMAHGLAKHELEKLRGDGHG